MSMRKLSTTFVRAGTSRTIRIQPKSTKSNTSLPLGKPDAPKVKAELFYAVRVESDGTVGLYEWDARTNKGWMRVWANKIEVKENA